MPNTSLRRPQKGFRRGGKTAYHGGRKTFTASSRAEGTSIAEKWEKTQLANSIDENMGFARYESGKRRDGWLVSVQSTSIHDERIPGGRAALDCYFIEAEGDTFKATVEYDPYFLIAVRRGREADVEEWAKRVPGGGVVKTIRRVEKDDLKMPNHLLGHRRTFLELRFANVGDLMAARKDIIPVAEKNKKNMDAIDTYAEVVMASGDVDLFDDDDMRDDGKTFKEASDFIIDIREYDVPYHVRVMIDLDIRVGKWYFVEAKHGTTRIWANEERSLPADPTVLAFDIETTKLPLKFPDATVDQIMMISYMIDGQGFLVTNRDIISEDIGDFEYTPKPEYPGAFIIFNEPNEKAVIERFFLHVKEARPTVIATYNGDFFDWPFVEARASINGIDMYQEIGWKKDGDDQFKCNYGVHMDCFHWVNRDSYLPQGSRGLKAVTVAKLGYDPDELDPELMTPYARERPQTLAEYSVSDAVATYYLYMKYVHPFIFSLCTILPLGGDDTLRKGTGTLCEMLLMVQAYKKEIVLPNKHQSPREAFWDGHLLDSETYVGGHVESIEAGVFRADIPVDFSVEPAAIDELLRDLDAALEFVVTVEEKKSMDDVENYDEVRRQMAQKLTELKERPKRHEKPLIYHLDVASMYPNIMTTNRLQPDSMISESDCAACDFNRPGKTCDRRMPWAWRGEYLPAKRDEYNMIRNALQGEKFPGKTAQAPARTFAQLSPDEQAGLVRKRLQLYSQKVYHKIHDSTTIVREAIICQRENPFYINTVRDFRDRRYDYKGKAKVWKGKTDELKSAGATAVDVEAAKKMVIVYDSLQLAHKVILNSFYGYVMRKGSRWYSMEMAGVTCLTGAHIIQMARQLVERLGRPLELDTDGIWCMLPASFPENFTLRLKNGKKMGISYPCVMLNHLVHARFTNDQYQTLVDGRTFRYETHSDNSIFFEVDGPYRAMVLPTSKEEDKNLKKRYAVFNHDGSLAELKGFEVKRRGELKLIKIFQQQIFRFFLEGRDLAECYSAVAQVANRWLDVLDNKGTTLADEELMDLISENRSMSKTLEEYGGQKSTSITTARRLADFLGDQMVKDKGLNCKFIICSKPRNAPVTQRAVPVAIFSADETVKRTYLRKWLKEDPSDTDPRALLDWSYYAERLGSVIQKLITIPAALQKVRNPVPRVPHPEWLQRRIRIKDDKMKQMKLTDGLLSKLENDMEDFGAVAKQLLGPKPVGEAVASSMMRETEEKNKMMMMMMKKKKKKRKSPDEAADDENEPPLPSKAPSPSENYSAFLAYEKRKWKMQKQARVRRRQLFGERRSTNMQGNNNIQQTFRKQAHDTFMRPWQLLQLKDTDSPGTVAAYVLIDGKMHHLKIRVNRQVYLNLKSERLPDVDIAGCEVEQVQHTLPNGHASTYLFRLTVGEDIYVAEADRFDQLFRHPSVEGVYETQVPLSVRAVLRLGNVCTVDDQRQGVLGRGLETGFELDGLKRPQKTAYLESWPLAYVFVSHMTAGERQVFGLFSSSGDEAHVVIVGGGGQDVMMPNMSNLYDDMLAARRSEADSNWQDCFRYQERLRFRTKQVTTRRKAQLEVADVVRRMRRDETGPLLAVVRSPHREQLVVDVPVLAHLPLLTLPYDSADGAWPPLGWQTTAARRLVAQYLGLGSWVAHLTALARYGDVPLCNLDRDDARFLIDVAYARRLQANGVVLWWSPGPRPDHGGHERDAVPTAATRLGAVNSAGSSAGTVCLDVEVRNLAVNTMLTSSLINELEGAASDHDVLVSDKAFSRAAVVVLGDMVKAWWAEACRGGTMADILVQHLVRWVESRRSFLFDEALHQHVLMMSRKALQQLMADFRRLGCQIIFTSADRIMLRTTKAEVGTAFAFGEYMVKSIKARPLFHFIDLEIRGYWDYLVWYDEHNYGGRVCRQRVLETDEVQQQLETVMHWQMATFLPRLLQPVFEELTTAFVERMHRLKRGAFNELDDEEEEEEEEAVEAGDAGSTPPRPTQLPKKKGADDEDEKRIVLGKPLMKTIEKTLASVTARQRRELLHPELASDYGFPKDLPGRHLTPTNPSLELSKTILQVLSLERSATPETRRLRRDVLSRLFSINDFSREASFANPSSSLRLEQVSCDNCTLARDLDLCRDEALLAGRPWRCPLCGVPYDEVALEERVLGLAWGGVAEWAVMDVVSF
ncbi:DNA polymerase epsilon [Ophiocordyceps camponoti-floridani]|uniref:DNA polymerase epsilon catalytic subunit n=1 Tax=Ophiocordyceps camponoti-floridani TaxID=2030778 RepID=A0A8H4Q5B0_9HYPO|nr:DNA polymerase epsilon [Ophiocordyceps camponoti-floridani]